MSRDLGFVFYLPADVTDSRHDGTLLAHEMTMAWEEERRASRMEASTKLNPLEIA